MKAMRRAIQTLPVAPQVDPTVLRVRVSTDLTMLCDAIDEALGVQSDSAGRVVHPVQVMEFAERLMRALVARQ